MKSEVRILRVQEWPAVDQAMWTRAVEPGGLFDDVGPLAHLSEQTLGMIQSGYGKWLTWLAETQPEVLILPPADRPTPARLAAFAEAYAYLSPETLNLYTSNAVRLLRACHPDRDWTAINRVVMRLHREADNTVSHRKDGRILSGDHVLAKGLELAGPMAEAAVDKRQRALFQRNGTLIAFLALIPVRRRALVSLQIGTSVVFDGDDIRIVTTPEMTKTQVYWETLVPRQLEPALLHYIDETRPWLMARCRDAHDYLWVTKDGAPLTGTAMGTLLRNQTQKLFEATLSPHLFRDIAATTLARSSPVAVGHVRALLGHRGHLTAEKYYNHASSLEVGRNYARLIDGVRKGG